MCVYESSSRRTRPIHQFTDMKAHTPKPLQPFAPSLAYPAEQSPHVTVPAVFMVHLRLLSQPPLLVRHRSASGSNCTGCESVTHYCLARESTELIQSVASLPLQAWMPSLNVWGNFLSPGLPHFPAQEPPFAQQVHFPAVLFVHLRHPVCVCVCVCVVCVCVC